ncbi:MAG: fused MFS/spermidine synthase [bacterium]
MLGILSGLVFLSGAAGLLYEVVWTRLLVHTLGSTAQAVASVLAAFLGGLAVGAVSFGRRADRSASPLRFYAMLEAGIAVFALAFPLLNIAFRHLVLAAEGGGHLSAAALAALRFVGTFVLLLPATAAMGGTIPVLCRLAVVRDKVVGRPAGALYAWNTFGATLGCLAAGFLLIPAIGLSATLRAGAATNLFVSGAALVLASRVAAKRAASEALAPAPEPARAAPLHAAQIVVLAAFALSGLAALGYEVLWTRVLVFFVKSVTYGFSLMLATFLAGLVLGSAACVPLADRRRFAARALPAIELAAGLVAYASIRLLVTRTEALRALAPTPGGPLGALYGPLVFLVVATILPTGILFGATFPLAVRLVADRASGAPGRVGLATAANTGGAIAGAFLGGFVLLPKLGLVRALGALVAVNVVAALALTRLFETRRARLLFGAVAVAAIAVIAPSRDFFVECLARIRPGRMIFVDEGADVIVNVYEEPPERPNEPPVRTVYVNGSSYTGSRFFARRYMKTMGHLPLLLCEEPRRALVICLGTGMTLSAVARHPELERVACAELSPGVLRALPLFDAVNDRVAERADVHVAIQDGRHWVQADRDLWDVITLEPPPPLNAGVGDLYSKEFYEICRDHLAPGGVLCQWFPMHSQTPEEYRMGLATFLDVFPDASLWLPVGRNSFAIGVRAGGTPWTFERLRSRFAEPHVAEAMREIGFPTPESVLATFVLNADAMHRFVADAPLVTDDRPRLEFHDLRQAARRFPAGELLRDLMMVRVDPTRMLEAEGRGAGIDAAAWERTSAALAHFYRGAFWFEARRPDDAAREWQEALRAEPENAYYRSIVGGEGTAPRAEG